VSVDLLIAGAGGFARETVSAVHAINRVLPTFRLLGLLDDDPALHGAVRAGTPILGPLDTVHSHPDAVVVVCIGNPRAFGVRAAVVRRLGLPPERYATLVHPSASVGAGCRIEPGTVILAGAVLTVDVTVGAHVSVMPHAVLTHDVVVEPFVTVASGAAAGGGVHLRTGCYLGAGAVLRENVTVGAGAQVGMGAVVLEDVGPGEVWVGNPARLLRRSPQPPAHDTSDDDRYAVGVPAYFDQRGATS
jgi:sugar O-acyltransferase (sialic acid O-acetyltransferase NeuD family)